MDLEELIAIDTQNPGADYSKMTSCLSKYLKSKGARTFVSKGNLLAVWGKPRLLLNAHVDTVRAVNWKSNPLEAVKTKNRITGLGAADTKGNIYCMLRAIKHKPKNLMVLFSSDEECGSVSGVEEFVKSSAVKHIERAIVLEPTENTVVSRHPGYYDFWLTFKTNSAGHSSLNGTSAVRKAAAALLKLPKFNVGVVTSNAATANVVASECSVEVSTRTYEPCEKVVRKIEGTLSRFGTEIRISCICPPFINKKPFISPSGPAPFWSEAALLSAAGINTVVYGAGSVNQAHRAGEFVSSASLKKCALFLEQVIGEYS